MRFLSTMFLLASLGASSAVHAAGAPPLVVDANGKVVGTLISPNYIMREIGGLMIGMQVDVDGFSTTSAKILFTTTDCTGTKYIGNRGLPLAAYTEVDGPVSGTVTINYPAGVSRIVHVRSFEESELGPCTTLPAQAPTQAGVVHSQTLTFTPPFAIR